MKALSPTPKTLRPRGAARVIRETVAPAPPPEADPGLVEHPDGWYWLAADGQQAFGPFASRRAALADRDTDRADGADSDGLCEAERLQEAQRDLGLADWIDAETGLPAEGLGRPHLDGA